MYGDITIGGDLNGEMEIQGSLRDTLGDTSGGHIIVNGSFGWGEISIDDDFYGDTEYISIDYDGWDEYDEWSEYADVIIDGNVYNYNTPSARIWECMSCKGNVNNSGTDPDEEYGQLDPNDPNILAIAINDPNDYAALFPGLEGSLSWHGDVNCDESIDQDDLTALEWLLADDCCMKACQFRACYADIIESGQVDLSDLSQLLGNWGKTPATREDGDLTGDNVVNLDDLAEMLPSYGSFCDCHAGRMRLMTLDGSYVDLSVAAFNTNGYAGGGFVGEIEHFVFDLKIQVNEPRYDDWIVSGAALTPANGAECRLAASPTTPDAYATFVAAPWTIMPGGSTANVAGAYDPADADSIFTAGAINLGWYDTDTASNDGPATVMRIVLDVSEVDGADVSSGFGSVYFSTNGPNGKDDILVAELNAGAGTKLLAGGLKTYWGEFYVKGD